MNTLVTRLPKGDLAKPRFSPLATRHRSGVSVFQCFSFSGLRSPTSSLHPQRKSSAFTLIELLVVIAIISILAGLGFAGLQTALESGKKAQARNDVQQIASAIRAFELEYGRLPSNTTGDDQWIGSNNENVIKALLGLDQGLNPRNIRFLEAKVVDRQSGGVDQSSYRFYDPWGSPYYIKLNTDYDNKINHYGDQFVSVIVHSTGPDKTMGKNDKIEGSDDITNFK
jgi:prepilin-type N-terminal cleavage/methylation domain-containing protein